MSTRKINILCLITCLATAVFVAVPHSARSQHMLYWAEEGGSSDDVKALWRINLDGTGIETLISGLTKVKNLALDLAGGKIYWTVLPGFYDMGFIRRANLDGSGIEEVLETQSPWSFDLDAPEGKMYWGSLGTNWNDYANHNIKRANFDGSNEEIICNLYTSALRLNLKNRKIYFRNGTKISYCNMEVGATVHDLVTGQVNISALALYLPPPAGTILRIY